MSSFSYNFEHMADMLVHIYGLRDANGTIVFPVDAGVMYDIDFEEDFKDELKKPDMLAQELTSILNESELIEGTVASFWANIRSNIKAYVAIEKTEEGFETWTTAVSDTDWSGKKKAHVYGKDMTFYPVTERPTTLCAASRELKHQIGNVIMLNLLPAERVFEKHLGKKGSRSIVSSFHNKCNEMPMLVSNF